ncbi:MAG: hypothetical protein KGS72_07710 [Cyanobacteria bacterium REEB67]|nr:hypothetical protein [Cyanobacteria bacterium REEB67]
MKFKATIAASLTLASCILNCTTYSNGQGQAAARGDTRSLRYAPAANPSNFQNDTMDPKNVPDFPADMRAPQRINAAPETGAATGNAAAAPVPGAGAGDDSGTSTALKADLASTTLPVETRLRLVLETPVDAKTSQPGNIFEAHVKDDLFIGSTLLLPRGSLVRGRVFEVSKPRLLSRAAKIGLKLEQIVTPTGEVIPLDAALEFQKGLTNQKGQFDPGTNFGTRVEGNVKSVTGMNSTGGARSALIAANVATLGAPAIATAIGGSAIAIFRSGDNVNLAVGQEIEVQLTNDLGVQIN